MSPASVGFQCPECVREARAEFRRGPGRRDAVANVRGVSATTVLLALMALGYAWMIVRVGTGALVSGPSPQQMYELGGSVGIAAGNQAIGLAAGEYWRLVSPIFLHYGILHLAVNAYSLWIVGRIVEDEYGRWREIAIFFATGIVASAASYALVSADRVAVGAGASGAIAGLFGVVLAHAYGRRHTALGAARMRAIGQVLVLNLILSFASSVIDWRAHLGGFVAGVVAGWLAEPSRRGGAVANAVGITVIGAAGVAIAVAKTNALIG
jgi:membrane associated rhomboid family serine protease